MAERYYAEFLYYGIIVSESSIKEITKSEYDNPLSVNVPKDSFGFRVMTRREEILDGDPLIGQYSGTSGWFYIGDKMSKAQVKERDGEDSILYRNMDNNGYNFVVRTKFGQAMPLRKGDVVI